MKEFHFSFVSFYTIQSVNLRKRSVNLTKERLLKIFIKVKKKLKSEKSRI